MIVSEVMTTRLVVVTPETTLGHAANLMRQHQFHHLPVVRMPAHTTPAWYGSETVIDTKKSARTALPLFEGLLTSQDIDLASAIDSAHLEQNAPAGTSRVSWQDRSVVEMMHEASVTVTPSTSVAAAAQLLVERGLDSLAVISYADTAQGTTTQETPAYLIGLITRSDLLLALARALGAYEPGVELYLPCHAGDLTPLAQTLLLAAELHIAVRSCLVAPSNGSAAPIATLRLGTIHPAPLLLRLQEEQIAYRLTHTMPEEEDMHG
jgi:acetoin utilization protein AcuB